MNCAPVRLLVVFHDKPSTATLMALKCAAPNDGIARNGFQAFETHFWYYM